MAPVFQLVTESTLKVLILMQVVGHPLSHVAQMFYTANYQYFTARCNRVSLPI